MTSPAACCDFVGLTPGAVDVVFTVTVVMVSSMVGIPGAVVVVVVVVVSALVAIPGEEVVVVGVIVGSMVGTGDEGKDNQKLKS